MGFCLVNGKDLFTGISYSYLYNYDQVNSLRNRNQISIFAGIPVVLKKVDISLKIGTDLTNDFKNRPYSYPNSQLYLFKDSSIGREISISDGAYNQYNLKASIPIDIFYKSLFFRIEPEFAIEYGRDRNRYKTRDYYYEPMLNTFIIYDSSEVKSNYQYFNQYIGFRYALGYRWKNIGLLLDGSSDSQIGVTLEYQLAISRKKIAK
jgi:hypothetical protein